MWCRTLVACLLVASSAVGCAPRDPCAGASSFEVTLKDDKGKEAGSFSLTARSTWAEKRGEDTFKIFAADYDQNPRDLARSVTVKDGALVLLDLWSKGGKAIAAGSSHAPGEGERTFKADAVTRRPAPATSLFGIVFDREKVKGSIDVKAVTPTMVCGNVKVSDGFSTIEGRFAATFAPGKK